MTRLKISIVTPTFNQSDYIEQTITSVLHQNYSNLEYIIIDGGSTDNTVEIIKKYSSHLTYWVSESDSGQANAINKGLKYCSGEIFNWLNSDDYLQPGALDIISNAFEDKGVDIVAGQVNNFSLTHSEVASNSNLSSEGLLRWGKGVQMVQPGVWMRRKHFIECGALNETFHYSFDWDMLIRYLYLFPSVKYLDEVLVNFRLHDQSKTVSSINKFAAEERVIIEALFKNPLFKNIHPACRYKIKRTKWNSFLQERMEYNNHSRIRNIVSIISNLGKQPLDAGTTRMTLGAIKKILGS
ncbi:MAG: glycosyltransferase family 2 protein [Ferruginibacter sp.]